MSSTFRIRATRSERYVNHVSCADQGCNWWSTDLKAGRRHTAHTGHPVQAIEVQAIRIEAQGMSAFTLTGDDALRLAEAGLSGDTERFLGELREAGMSPFLIDLAWRRCCSDGWTQLSLDDERAA